MFLAVTLSSGSHSLRQAVAYEKLTDGVPYMVWGHSATHSAVGDSRQASQVEVHFFAQKPHAPHM